LALIEVKGLTKLYRMGDSVVRALDGVDLTIERGEFVAITGASGSGKSTIMHLIGGLDRPTSGRFLFDGRDFSDLSDRQLANMRNRQIGFVFQTFNLINRITALDNVAVPLFYARRANTHGPALRALERVGLAHRAHHHSNELSGGERQRVAIARAIVNDPPLLLADEPTGNLDSRTGQQIMEIFRELNRQGVTIVLVTHEHEVAVQARRIVQMRDGKIVADRLTSEMQSQAGLDGLQVRMPVELETSAPAIAARGAAATAARAPAEAAGAGTIAATAGASTIAAAAAGVRTVTAGARVAGHSAIRAPEQPEPSGSGHTGPVRPEGIESRGVATIARAPTEPADSGLDLGPRRLAPGANATFILGLLALVVVLAAIVFGVVVQVAASGLNLESLPPQERVKAIPRWMMIGSVLMILGWLGGFVTGIVALVVARLTRKRMRDIPGNWYGGLRIWIGVAAGCLASFGPLVAIAANLVVKLLR